MAARLLPYSAVALGTDTTGNYVSDISGTANQITASSPTGSVTLSIPSDFRAPGTLNSVTSIATGAGAGTTRIDASGNLVNIGNITTSSGTTIQSGSGNITLQPSGTGTTGSIVIGAANGGAGSATPDLIVLDKTSGANPTGVEGSLLLDSTGKFNIFEGGAWKVLCNKTDAACGAGSGSALSAISAAVSGNTINSTDNAQVWNWALTTAAKTAFTFGENTAAINGAGSQYILNISTLASSTAAPLKVVAQGNTIINTTNTGGVTIGDATAAQAITIDAGTATLSLGNSNNAKTINIGTGSAVDTVHIADGGGADVITIGGGSGTLALNTSNIDISAGGAVSGATGITSSGTIAFSGLSTNGPVYTTGGTGTLASEANLSVVRGGTGAGTFTTNGVLFGNGTSALGVTAQGAAGTVLHGNAGVPSFSAVSLTADVTGILPIANGGTNASTSQGAINNLSQLTTNGDLLYNDGTNSTRLARGSNTQCLTSSATTIVWGSCSATATLQTAYNNGNTITTTDARNISITLADTATDQTFEITQAGTANAFRVNDDGTFSDTTPFVIDASGNVGIGTASPTLGKVQIVGTSGQSTVGLYEGPDTSSFGAYAQGEMSYASNIISSLNTAGTRGYGTLALIEDNTTNTTFGLAGAAVATNTSGTKLNNSGVYGEGILSTAGTVTSLAGVTGFATMQGTSGTASRLASIYSITNGRTAGTVSLNAGLYLEDQSGVANTSTNNYQIYSATTNPFVVRSDGNVGIGDTSPSALLTVGNGDLFQVNSSGAIAAATGVTSSGTITFSGFSTNKGLLYTDASGVLGQTAQGAANTVLHGNGTTAPSFSPIVNGDITNATIDLTTKVTGILPIANGGTNSSTSQGAINNISQLTTNGDLLYNDGTNSTRLARGSNTQCLTSNTTTIVWGSCAATATLQTAYGNGNTITTTDARDIAITLADTTTDSNLTISTATGSTGFTSITRADGAGTADPAQLLLVKNNDTDRAQPLGISVQAAAGGITTAFDASTANITNALAIGAHAITGTNFAVTGAGAVTAVGVNSGTGLIQGTGGLTLTGTTSINASTNSATNINTGTSNTLVSIGGGSGTFALDTTNIDISSAGAITGATGITSSGTIAFGGLTTNGPVYTTGGTGTLASEANLSVVRGGTGAGTFTTNGVLFGNGTSALGVTAQGGANTVLIANSGVPSFSSAVTIGTSVTSPVINATTAIQTAGTNRIDSSGNLVNIGNLTAAAGSIITTTGNSASLTVNTGTGTSGNSGGITIQTGDIITGGTSGSINIDTGVGITANGTITLGPANASAISLGRSGITTTNNGALTVTQAAVFNGGASIASGQNLTLNSGAGVISQTYTSGSASSAISQSTTNTNAGGSSIALNAYDLTLVGTATSGGVNTNSAIKFENPSAAANNVFYGLNFAGTGYTDILRVGSTQVINGSGQINSTSITGTLFTLAGSSGSATVSQGQTATLVQGSNITTTGAAGPQVTIAVVSNPTFSGLVTGQAGLTVTGAAVSLNASSNFNVDIATGSSTGTVTLGGTGTQSIAVGNGAGVKTVNLGSSNTTSTTTLLSGSGGLLLNVSNNQPTNINTGTSSGTITLGGGSAPLVIDSTNFDVSSAGVISGATGVTSSGTIAFSGLSTNGPVYTTGGTGIDRLPFYAGRNIDGPAGLPDRPIMRCLRRKLRSSGSDLPGRLIELAFDLGQLLLAAHDPRPLEPRSRPCEVVDHQEDHRERHERPADVPRRRE